MPEKKLVDGEKLIDWCREFLNDEWNPREKIISAIKNAMAFNSERPRVCFVKGEIGFFHRWAEFAQPVAAGLTIGSAPAGEIRYTVAIVELADGTVVQAAPTAIVFAKEDDHA